MKKRTILLILIFILGMYTIGYCSDKISKTIFIANSYNPETFEWTRNEIKGIVVGLQRTGEEQGKEYSIINDTMDVFINSSGEALARESERILKRIKEEKPDIVITTDDDALHWIGLKIEDIPVVFSGINEDMQEYLKDPKLDTLKQPGHNITGVYQVVYAVESMDILKRINPDVKKFAVITDKSTTGIAVLKQLNSLQEKFSLKWEDTLVSDSFSVWQKKIKEWQDSVDAIVLITPNEITDDDGNSIDYKNVINWIVDNSRLPDITFWKVYVKEGIMAASADSDIKQGVYAGIMAGKILQGDDPGRMPIITPFHGARVLNGTRVKKLDLYVPLDILAHSEVLE
ncbi:MAG: hypothetical protein GY853_10170 [PVC group bacterium]|nr:hypothetical protein [PVC group bacterium]